MNPYLGNYQLTKLIEIKSDQEIWFGTRTDTGQAVEIVLYTGADPSDFLADARVKSTTEDPVLRNIYQIFEDEERAAFAREILPARSLAQMVSEERILLPAEVVRILSIVSNSLWSAEKRGSHRANLNASDIRFGAQDEVRLCNFTAAVDRRTNRHSRRAIATSFQKLLRLNVAASARVGTLLEMMAGSPTRGPLSWKEISELAHQVEEELSRDQVPLAAGRFMNENRDLRRNVILAGAAVAVLGSLFAFFVFFSNSSSFYQEAVLVPAGRYPGPDGELTDLEAFRIDSSEVTIEHYAEFITAWGEMSQAERGELLPLVVMREDWSMDPTDWDEYYPVALSGGVWKGRQISPQHPVTGVDWWDATAYARWRGDRLPSAIEWWAAASRLTENEESSSELRAVGGPGKGPHNMGGNVAEWAATRSPNLDNPSMPDCFSLLGASFANEGEGAMEQEWVDSPSLARDDVGFRVVYSVKQ